MTDSHKEQHPLLCDEYSDEEYHIQDSGPKFQRRYCRTASTGRARTHAVGAAAIITSWPDHISSLLAYWWIGLGMIAVMVFLIYNSFLAIAVLPRSNYHPTKIISTKYSTENRSHENPSTPNIYMHVFVANYNEFNSYNYIPYVKALAMKYANFKYNFVVVLNDATQDIVNDLSDEQKNDMALNSLREDGKIMSKRETYDSTTVKYVTLTKYMDNSPLKKYWRLLPHKYVDFLVRCIAIWNKGGVAFNPLILTPNSPSSVYLEQLHSVLDNFETNNKLAINKKRKILKKTKKKFNNIRDIINGLENGELNANIFSDSLTEAENIESVKITSLEEQKNSNLTWYNQNNYRELIEKHKEVLHKNNTSYTEDNKILSHSALKTVDAVNITNASGISVVKNIFPKFLEFLFHLNSKNLTLNSQNLKNDSKDLNSSENVTIPKINPILNRSGVKIKPNPTNETSSANEHTKMIIDLKGNLIATEIGCHAFIGTVFSNVLHHSNEKSLTDFIIYELSLFCKGNLSTCHNVEVLLV